MKRRSVSSLFGEADNKVVIIVKKLVPVFKPTDNVPKKYQNLKKAVHVTSFAKLYPNIPKILVDEYGLSPNEKIVVFWTKEAPRPNWPNYRLPFKKVYSGRLREFGEYMKKVRAKRTGWSSIGRSPNE